jgi:hypothetical protein
MTFEERDAFINTITTMREAITSHRNVKSISDDDAYHLAKADKELDVAKAHISQIRPVVNPKRP